MVSVQVKDLTVYTNNDKSVTVNVEVRAYLDSHYGADADGNRGTRKWLIDDVIFEVPNTDDDGYPLSQDEKNQVEKLVDEKVGSESWDFNRN